MNTPQHPKPTDVDVLEGERILREIEGGTPQQPVAPVPPVAPPAPVPGTPTPVAATPAPATPKPTLKVICGANTIELEDMRGFSVEQVRHKLAEVMNLSNEHSVIIVNGRQIDASRPYALEGDEELEFKKMAGTKG